MIFNTAISLMVLAFVVLAIIAIPLMIGNAIDMWDEQGAGCSLFLFLFIGGFLFAVIGLVQACLLLWGII